MAEQGNIHYILQQRIDLALTIIKRPGDFDISLGEWDDKPLKDKTWDCLKTHFSAVQNKLKKVCGPSMTRAGFDHANHLAQEFQTTLDNHRHETATMMASIDRKLDNLTHTTSTSTLTDPMTHHTTPAVMTMMAKTPKEQQLTDIILGLQKDMNKLKSKLSTSTTSNKSRRSKL